MRPSEARQTVCLTFHINCITARDRHWKLAGLFEDFDTLTWTESSQMFHWRITRPDAGVTVLTKHCPVCGKRCKLRIDSLDRIKSKMTNARRMGCIGLIALPLFIILLVALFVNPEPIRMTTGLSLTVLFAVAGIGAFISFGFTAAMYFSKDEYGFDLGNANREFKYGQSGHVLCKIVDGALSNGDQSAGRGESRDNESPPDAGSRNECLSPPDAQPVAPRSSHKVQTVGDYLKLVGMRVSFHTKQDDFVEGEVIDISDSGTHVVLRDVTHDPKEGASAKYDKKNILIADIDWIDVKDRHGRMP